MNYSEGCKVKTRQSVHQYRAIKTGKLYTLYILDKYRSQEGGGGSSHTVIWLCLFPVVMTVYFWNAQRKETPSKAAETDATKPFRSPSLTVTLSLLFLLLPMQVFSRISVLISFTVAFFSSLFLFFFPPDSENGVYVGTSAGCYSESGETRKIV